MLVIRLSVISGYLMLTLVSGNRSAISLLQKTLIIMMMMIYRSVEGRIWPADSGTLLSCHRPVPD